MKADMILFAVIVTGGCFLGAYSKDAAFIGFVIMIGTDQIAKAIRGEKP